MFNVGGPEIVLILLVALVVLGPEQLPKAMRTFGNVMGEIRKVSGSFQDEMRNAMDTIESTGSTKDSPGEAGSTTSATGATAATPADADVTEVVARNDGPPTSRAGDKPPIDPADRAAG